MLGSYRDRVRLTRSGIERRFAKVLHSCRRNRRKRSSPEHRRYGLHVKAGGPISGQIPAPGTKHRTSPLYQHTTASPVGSSRRRKTWDGGTDTHASGASAPKLLRSINASK